MAKKLGHEYKLFIDDGAGTFNEIAGQTGLTRDGSTELIDQSSKTTGQFAIQAPGRKNFTITCPGKTELPDANGLERVHTLQKAYPQVAETFQIRVSPFATGDVVFQADMYISNFSMDDPDQDNSTYTFQLTLATAPATDLLEPAP